MTRAHRRVTAVAVVAALAGLFSIPSGCKQDASRPGIGLSAESDAIQVAPAPGESPSEVFIEDDLAQIGEEPGATYSLSRVREALNEGNPAFARELLRQMREEHEGSPLVLEAESLFKETKRKRGK